MLTATSAFLVFGDHTTVRIEQDAFKSMEVVCAWPRQTMYFERHDLEQECGWTWPEWDEAEMYNHAWSHLRETDA